MSDLPINTPAGPAPARSTSRTGAGCDSPSGTHPTRPLAFQGARCCVSGYRASSGSATR